MRNLIIFILIYLFIGYFLAKDNYRKRCILKATNDDEVRSCSTNCVTVSPLDIISAPAEYILSFLGKASIGKDSTSE